MARWFRLFTRIIYAVLAWVCVMLAVIAAATGAVWWLIFMLIATCFSVFLFYTAMMDVSE